MGLSDSYGHGDLRRCGRARKSVYVPGTPNERGRAKAALETRIEATRYRGRLGLAERAEDARDWRGAARALSVAEVSALKLGVQKSELERLRADARFVEAMLEAGSAREAGGTGPERKRLFRAAELRPDHPAVLERLAALGAGPDAARDLLARARAAFDGGKLEEVARLAKAADECWPSDDRPEQVLTYIEDRSSCKKHGMLFVSAEGPWKSWGPEERARAFCIDPHEASAKGRPRAFVSAVEAAAACRRRGARLCTLREWRLACGGPEGLQYPYGNMYVFNICNAESAGPRPPGGLKECLSPFGAYDMSGNVAEWTADHVRGRGQAIAGGDWSSREANSQCTSVIHFKPELTSPRVGFRCCRAVGHGGQE